MATKCKRCNGTGAIPCKECKRKGKIDVGIIFTDYKKCNHCGGSGEVKCGVCEGKGNI